MQIQTQILQIHIKFDVLKWLKKNSKGWEIEKEGNIIVKEARKKGERDQASKQDSFIDPICKVGQ